MKIGLVIEGGGFRGVFCEGITSYFIENNIEIPYVIGVSMGAINATNYLAKQAYRNIEIIEQFIDDKRYISKRNLFKTGNLFGMDFIFNDIAHIHHPFDFKTFSASKQEFVIVSMDCNTGQPHYAYKAEHTSEEMMKALRASTSLPFVSKQVLMNDTPYLDGGITDPIPIRKALEDGCDKVIVMLTRDLDYIKAPFKGSSVGKVFYNKYPEVVSGLKNRHKVYRDSQVYLEQLETEGKAFVFRPKIALDVDRTEKDFNKIKYAFDAGYALAKEKHQSLLEFMK